MLNPTAFGQTIAVVDRSGKVVSTSKHLINVFKEAKSAYRERKAEIVAGRHAHAEEKRTRHSGRAYTIDDDRSSRHSHSEHHSNPISRKPVADHRHSGGSVRSSGSSRHGHGESISRFEQGLRNLDSETRKSPRQELARRHTTRHDRDEGHALHPGLNRSMSTPGDIDMDLAYGELPADLPLAVTGEEAELKGLVGKVKQLLDEADCVQYSVTAIIANLQKNPDAMAAVALTLAEISNIVSKMAPGVLMSLKGSAPAVFALLASPQFLIAAGVGVGVTIVAFGGYKIIKKIKAKHAGEEDPGVDEMLAYDGDIDRINSWRRGISEAEEQSIGTSVDGEFITPQAAALSRLNLNDERISKSHRQASDTRSSKESRPASSSKDFKSSKSSKEKKEKRERDKDKDRKEKKPSPLRLMFK